MANEDRGILEERVLPSDERVLSSKRYSSTLAGTVLREIRKPFCDWCGVALEDERARIICCVCGKKLCDSPSCAAVYDGKHFCQDDLHQILPLSRLQFKIIHGLVRELDLDSIRELTRSRRREFDSALDQLRTNRYVEKKGVSLFSIHVVLGRGVLAWKTYEGVFRAGDVPHFIEEVDNYVKEVGHSDIERKDRERR